MRNKGGIIFLTVIIALISVYQLSFTLKSRSIEKEIQEEAEITASSIEPELKAEQKDAFISEYTKSYKDSIKDQKVYDLGFKDYTYSQINKNKLKLGLDLQGGMLITLIVSPDELLKEISGNNPDPAFEDALARAKSRMKSEQESFVNIFYEEYTQINGKEQLAQVFSTESNQSTITPDSKDSDILKVLNKEVADALERSRIILENRLNKYGSSQPIIQTIKATGRIEIQMPGVDDEDRITTQISSIAKLEFLEVWHGSEIQPIVDVINDFLIQKRKAEQDLVAEKDTLLSSASVDDSGIASTDDDSSDDALFATDDESQNALFDTPKDTVKAKKDTTIKTNDEFPFADYFQVTGQGQRDVQFMSRKKDYKKIEELMNDPELRKLLPDNVSVLWDVNLNKAVDGLNEQGYVPVYFVKKGPNSPAPLTGDKIDNARQDFDQQGRVAVSMSMNSEGAKIWQQMTKENIDQRIAVCLDDIVYSAPYVNEAIPSGNSIISGSFDIQEAQDLSNILKAGKLPAPTEIERMVTVGPSLGQESINRGLLSLVCGLALVVLFMILYYNKGGLVADIALLFNIFFIIGILSTPAIEAALTLPGIAGIVLTIGMSIDANVLIFERIREEMQLGRPTKIAVANGYKKAFTTIIDSNATTLITGAILFAFGSALVKGFAITLIIGIACSFFSAVFITRLIIEWMLRKNEKANLSFTTTLSKKLFEKQAYNFISKRKIAYVVSGVIIAVGIASIVAQGLNLGVAFKGGYSYVVAFDENVEASAVKSELRKSFENASTETKTFDGDDKLKITTSYLVDSDDKDAQNKVKAALLQGLEKYKDLNPKILESVVVSSTIADDIKSTSVKSTIFALLAIFIYIIFRFRKWQFGLGAIAALFHDVLIVFSVFSIARWLGISYEIDEVFIGALLTVVGYSINDTVVVFDRVREFLTGRSSASSLEETLNSSLNSTLSRTLMTSITTLLVIVVLFLFGGEALKGFSFALLIGVLIGTYSSIFIATPVVMDASKKEEK